MGKIILEVSQGHIVPRTQAWLGQCLFYYITFVQFKSSEGLQFFQAIGLRITQWLYCYSNKPILCDIIIGQETSFLRVHGIADNQACFLFNFALHRRVLSECL